MILISVSSRNCHFSLSNFLLRNIQNPSWVWCGVVLSHSWVLQTFDVCFQWHLMQRDLCYLVAATRQLFSGLNSQNCSKSPKLFRKSYIPSGGGMSDIIPEASGVGYVFNYLRTENSILKEFFFFLLSQKFLSALLKPYPASVWALGISD